MITQLYSAITAGKNAALLGWDDFMKLLLAWMNGVHTGVAENDFKALQSSREQTNIIANGAFLQV
ncbi:MULTISPECIES: hypothetical protein [Bradyrhizobium]|uniref:Uncharacterized protein n=1 Tax=Bradyrhizobium ottawaense TaxID=931866 RepID=A0ABV4FHQ2_9BRAD|nr:hypothetical protein [Bradyrhizobium sp. CCBAU 15615]